MAIPSFFLQACHHGMPAQTGQARHTGKWTTDKMDQSILIGMLKGIVAFEIPVLRIEAKRKMSQNKNTDIQKLSIDGLRSMNDLQSSSVADEMESNI